MALLRFDIHQRGNQCSQLGISTLATIGVRDFAAKEFQDAFKHSLQLVRQTLCLGDTPLFNIRAHLQQLVEAFMCQTKGSETGEVIHPVAIALLQSKHKVMQCLCVVSLRLGCRGPISGMEFLHW